MLEEVGIHALGVIEEAVLELGPGLNVVTGETGAGKTMVMTAVGLLLGQRADSSLVRRGADRLRVEGRIQVDPSGPVAARVIEAGADVDDDGLIIMRTVTAEGRSRATVGGVSVPAGLLAELGSDLVAVHGQSDQHRLRSPQAQLGLLDAFGGSALAAELSSYRQTFDRLQQVEHELADVAARTRERAQEADLLRFGLDEIDQVRPESGEDEALAAEEARLGHADSLRALTGQARLAIAGDAVEAAGADAVTLIGEARRQLEAAAALDPGLDPVARRLADAGYGLSDAAAELSAYLDRLDVDPTRLAAVSERRARIAHLLRKYGDSVDEVLAWERQAASRLTELDDDERAAALRVERDQLRARLVAAGARLSRLRRAAASELGSAVETELRALAMASTRFTVSVSELMPAGPQGVDEVAFCLADGEHAAPRPIQRGASGGELSRVMLALELCLADASVPTFVFDEVDAGIGGKAAVEVGRRLARLAHHAQVVVVTHLPQVAAFAHRHHVVVRDPDGSVTKSGVHALDDAGRSRELSRMLAGQEDSETALAHAAELLELARSEHRRSAPKTAG